MPRLFHCIPCDGQCAEKGTIWCLNPRSPIRDIHFLVLALWPLFAPFFATPLRCLLSVRLLQLCCTVRLANATTGLDWGPGPSYTPFVVGTQLSHHSRSLRDEKGLSIFDTTLAGVNFPFTCPVFIFTAHIVKMKSFILACLATSVSAAAKAHYALYFDQ